MGDLISRKALLAEYDRLHVGKPGRARKMIEDAPSAQPDPLTDAEQRIFLAAMEREEDVCKEVDEKYPYKEPYEDSLIQICKEIRRKVKDALWT